MLHNSQAGILIAEAFHEKNNSATIVPDLVANGAWAGGCRWKKGCVVDFFFFRSVLQEPEPKTSQIRWIKFTVVVKNCSEQQKSQNSSCGKHTELGINNYVCVSLVSNEQSAYSCKRPDNRKLCDELGLNRTRRRADKWSGALPFKKNNPNSSKTKEFQCYYSLVLSC